MGKKTIKKAKDRIQLVSSVELAASNAKPYRYKWDVEPYDFFDEIDGDPGSPHSAEAVFSFNKKKEVIVFATGGHRYGGFDLARVHFPRLVTSSRQVSGKTMKDVERGTATCFAALEEFHDSDEWQHFAKYELAFPRYEMAKSDAKAFVAWCEERLRDVARTSRISRKPYVGDYKYEWRRDYERTK